MWSLTEARSLKKIFKIAFTKIKIIWNDLELRWT